MKKIYKNIPHTMKNMETFGFSWMDFVTAIPSPLFVVTTYKSNGKPNACLQSWACFNGGPNGFYAILSSVKKSGHLYQSVQETKEAVLSFPSEEWYDKCVDTIANNQFDYDEITMSGLTSEQASVVNAPLIKECFLNLECRYLWEREIAEGNSNVLMCFEVAAVCAEEMHLDEKSLGRYGDTGYLYNIHYPINPENFQGKSHDWIATLQKKRDMGEY